MIRAVTGLVVVAALTLLAGTGCKRSDEVTNPKAEMKDRAPLKQLEPAGVPGSRTKPPTTGSQ